MHAGEETVLHHLRRAGDQALTEAGNGPAGLRRALDVNDRVGAIRTQRDHGITFHASHKLRTVIWEFAGQTIANDMLTDVERLSQNLTDCDSEFYLSLSKLLSETEISALSARIRRILKSKKYPPPGPGPNYPWPPV